MMGEDRASNKSNPMGTEEGKVVIAAEKGPAIPMMPKLEASGKDSLLAPSQFIIPIATASNH